jgi:hypothetical protein
MKLIIFVATQLASLQLPKGFGREIDPDPPPLCAKTPVYTPKTPTINIHQRFLIFSMVFIISYYGCVPNLRFYFPQWENDNPTADEYAEADKKGRTSGLRHYVH